MSTRPNKPIKNPAAVAATSAPRNDDDAERIARRKSMASDQIPAHARPPPTKKAKRDDPGDAGGGKASGAVTTTADKAKQAAKAQMSGKELSNLYNQVLKLSSENVRSFPAQHRHVPLREILLPKLCNTIEILFLFALRFTCPIFYSLEVVNTSISSLAKGPRAMFYIFQLVLKQNFLVSAPF